MDVIKTTRGSDAEPASPTSTLVGAEFPKTTPEREIWPRVQAGFLSRLFFQWVSPTLRKGSKRPLNIDDLWQLPEEYQTKNVTAKLQQHYNELTQRERENPTENSETSPLLTDDPSATLSKYTLFWAMYRSFKKELWQTFTLSLLSKLFYVLSPLCTGHIIRIIAESSTNPKNTNQLYEGVVWSIGLFFLQFFGLVFNQQGNYLGKVTHVWMKGGLTEMISRKSMKLSQRARTTMTDGRINTTITSDTYPLAWGIMHLVAAMTFPIIVVVGFTLLIRTLGFSALVGLIIMLLSSPLQKMTVSLQVKYKKAQRAASDIRINIISDTIKYFSAVRCSGYEELFVKKIQAQRKIETDLQEQFLGRQADSKAVMSFLPILATSSSLITYRLLGHPMDAAIIFASIHYFVAIRNYGLAPMPKVAAGLTSAVTALGRITELLQAEENVQTRTRLLDDNTAIDIKGDFNYRSADNHTDNQSAISSFGLRNIDLKIPKGSLVCVIGRVGTGKSSLLYSLMNEIEHSSGHLKVNGKITYVPQMGWIQSGTILENITWSKHKGEIDTMRLDQVIKSCALEEDIDAWQDREYTKVGERGITISGGQRQRICLARAAYAESDIVLLDDPLSAVDPHVGLQLLRNCILAGPMAGQTRLLVTHQLDVLPKADLILVMDRDRYGKGYIAQSGDYAELQGQPGIFQDLLAKYKPQAYSPETDSDDKSAEMVNKIKFKTAVTPQEVYTKEDQRIGAVDSQVFFAYFSAVKSSPLLACVGILLFVHVAIFNLNTLFLGAWVDNHFPTFTSKDYMLCYIAIGLVYAATLWLTVRLLYKAALRASFYLFEEALLGVFHSPLSWHLQTPNGRILNRLSKDIQTLDTVLPPAWFDPLVKIINVVIIAAIIASIHPGLIGLLIVYVIYAVLLGNYYRRSLREAKRLGSTLLTDVYSSFAEQLAGLAVVRAFGQQERCIEQLRRAVDMQHAAYLLKPSMVHWFTVRMSATWIILAMCTFAIFNKESINAAQFGAILVLTMQALNNVTTTITLLADIEAEMNKVERVMDFASLPKEGDARLPNDPEEFEVWPRTGEVEFRNVKMRYRPDLQMILKDVSFKVQPGEKVGIIGRTGAGKSSLGQALFRSTNLEEGTILIDGADITNIGLQTLRERISIIPQEAFLFSGTVRENIDPEGKTSDAHLNDVLKLVQQSSNVSASLKAKLALDAEVHAEGGNFSAGERQLLALLRAIVRGSKVMMMDEATSSVDPETDALIQKLIQSELADTTLLSIAHRLQTVAYYDKIIVMEAGQVVEMGSPTKLFEDPTSHFRQLCLKKGITHTELIRIRQDAGLQ